MGERRHEVSTLNNYNKIIGVLIPKLKREAKVSIAHYSET